MPGNARARAMPMARSANCSKGGITLLAGGVGAARLLRGLARVVPAKQLTVVVNTGDDDQFHGLHVSPDLDTIVYTLAGLAPIERGWGIDGDTFAVRNELETVAGPGWFALGDRDLATHIQRTRRLREGATLAQVTAELAKARGIRMRILPVTNDPLRTVIRTPGGDLAFQDYLVRRRAKPRVVGIRLQGARRARPAPGVLEAIAGARMVLLAPSNPFVSIGPMLAVPGVRAALAAARSRVVAVSPLIGGRAVKGPLASMLRSMGHGSSAEAIARIYRGLAGTLVVAKGDAAGLKAPRGMRIVEDDILLLDPRRSERLARKLIALGDAQSMQP